MKIIVPSPKQSSVYAIEASPHEVAKELKAEVKKLSERRATIVAQMGTTPRHTPEYNKLFEESLALIKQIEDLWEAIKDIGPLSPRKATLPGFEAAR